MPHHVISGLKWARLSPKPKFAVKGARLPRGVKGEGVRFERKVAKALPLAQHGVWFEFEDSRGLGHCQPDLLLIQSDRVIVIECKLTWTPVAQTQLSDLYLPVVEFVFGLPVVLVTICRNLTPTTPRDALCDDLRAALSSSHSFPVIHWLGSTKLV